MALLFSVFIPTVFSIPNANATSNCLLTLTAPVLLTPYTAISMITTGQPTILRYVATAENNVDCSNQDAVVVTEVRNSENITEYISWQALRNVSAATDVGISWLPIHDGNYQVHVFAVSGLDIPRTMSQVYSSTITITANQNSNMSFIAIPRQQPDHGWLANSNFYPSFIKVVIGSNNTVNWVNIDNSSHVLIGKNSKNSAKPVVFDRPIYLYPNQSVEQTFNEAGLYEYVDKNNPSLDGFVQVLPQFQPNTVNVRIPEGTNVGGGTTYEPQLVRVVIGQNNTVTWTNDSNETNGVWADDSEDPQFYAATHSANQSNNLQPRQSFSYTFTKPGIIQYHGPAYITGTVIVSSPNSKVDYNYYDGAYFMPTNLVIRQNYTGLNQSNGIVNINNQSYYMNTLDLTNSVLTSEPIQFHNVTFTFPYGENNTPGESLAVLQIAFGDGSKEVIGKQVRFEDGSGSGSGVVLRPIGPSNVWNMTATTILTNHIMPQAGVTVIPGQEIKLLVSTQ